MATALKDCHAAGVVHCDFEYHNLLRSRSGRFSLCDLGEAKMVGETFLGFSGSKNLPPETDQIGQDKFVDGFMRWAMPAYAAMDIYAFGICLAELSDLCQMNQRTSPLGGLIEQCLDPDPEKRPSAGQIVERIEKGAMNRARGESGFENRQAALKRLGSTLFVSRQNQV